MLTNFIYIAFMIMHLFVQTLWILTSRGRNIESFIKTWTNLRRIPIVLFQSISFLQILFLSYLSFPIIQNRSMVLELTGLLISLSGFFFASWAKVGMGDSWGGLAQHDKKLQSTLVTTGPFAYSRNPIYVGLFLYFLGQQIALQSYGIFLSPVFMFAIKKAVLTEEALLIKYFGKTYTDYQTKVPRFL